MRTLTNIIGIILVILGVVSLGYRSFNYTKQEKVIQFGDVEVTANTEKQINIPPLASGGVILAGIVLIALGRMGKS